MRGQELLAVSGRIRWLIQSSLFLAVMGGLWAAPQQKKGKEGEKAGGESPGESTLENRLRAAGIGAGTGAGRIQSVPSREFRPRTLVESPLQSKLEVDSAIDQLRSGAGAALKGGSRAPSSELKGFLRETQAQARDGEPLPRIAGMGSRGKSTPPAVPGGEAQEVKGEQFALYAVAKRKPSAGRGGDSAPMVIFDQSPDFDFASIEGPGAPFYVFDVDPSETILVELSGDEVARVCKQGQDWAWIQLDSGLMGLIRNHHVKAAGEFEILKYLALEYGKMKEDGLVPPEDGGRVRVNKVNGTYQVATVSGKDVPLPPIGSSGAEEPRKPEVIEATGEYEILKHLALQYRSEQPGGAAPAKGEGPVRITRVGGEYHITGPDGKAVPLPPIVDKKPVEKGTSE